MQVEKTYTQKYNETHYRQINMRVSEKIALKFDELKPKYGSAPKLLSAGLEALENQNNFEIELEKLKDEYENLKRRNELLEKNNTKKSCIECNAIQDLDERNKKLRTELSEFENKSILGFIIYRLQSWWD